MSQLSAQEKEKFTAAASSMLAKQEKMELLAEQVKNQLGGVPGRVPAPQSQVDDIMAPGYDLIAVLAELKRAHPDVPAFRFRGRVIALTEGGGRVGVSIIKEADIEVVDG